MQKESVGYFIKKWAGIAVLRGFEQIIKIIDGNKEYYSPENFPFIKTLEQNWESIRDEYLKVNSSVRIPNIGEVFIEQARISEEDGWRSYMLTIYGYDFIDHLRECAVTTTCLKQIPMMTSAFFSVLQPGKSISPHRGIYKGVLRCHLALIVPEESKCEIVINGISANWREGKCVVFDDTFWHSAHNKTEHPRVVLFIDFIRPLPKPFNYINLLLFRLIAKSEFIIEVLKRSEKLDGVKFRKRFPLELNEA